MKSSSSLALAVTTCLLAVPAAYSQEAIEEVIVTATKREQTAQTVANQITVFSTEDLDALRVLRPQDLAEQTPGLLTKFGPNGLATVGFYMRGVGINDFTGTVDPSVGVYVDEVFKPTPDMLNFAVFDIERVEVLKGPQGTLYGRNSTGGAVNFITAKPTEEYEGFVRAGYSSFTTGALTGALSGPLSDNLLGRFSYTGQVSDDNDGYSFNRTTDKEQGKNDLLALRGQLAWQPNENVNFRLMINYGSQESDQPLLQHVGGRDVNDPAVVCAPVIAGQRAEGPCVDLLGYFDPDDDPFDGDSNVNPNLDIEGTDITGTLNWEFDRLTLTSITGYEMMEKRQAQDIDASPNVAADNFTYNDVDNFSQEVRFTSDDSWPVSWIVGGNYAETDVEWFQTIDLSDLAIPTSNGADQTTESWAAFGQTTIPLSDKFEFVGGLRFTNEERTWEGATFVGTFANLDEAFASGAPTLSILPVPDGNPDQGGPLDFDNKIDESEVDFQAVLKYMPDDDKMVYLSASKAFRSGGFSSAVLFSQSALEPFDSETLTAYEAGLKLSLPDYQVRFNGSIFFYDYEGFQATFVRALEASARLQNAGDVDIMGIEASIDWLPTSRLAVNLGISALDTEIVATEVVLPPLDGGPESTIEGNEIPNAPGLSINGRLSYDLPVGSRFFATLQTDFNRVSSHFLEPNNRAVLSESGYSLVNARVSLVPVDGQWDVSLWARNLTDEVYSSAGQDIILALGWAEIVLGPPLTWGVEFGYRF